MNLRIDKFLKVSRLIKRRTVAKQVADMSRIEINGKVVKPSKTVSIGDKVTLTLGLKVITVEVTALKPSKDALMYTLLHEEKRSY